MINLILKDILIQKKTSLFFIAFLIFAILLSQRTNGTFNWYIGLSLFCISYNFIDTAVAIDEFSQKMIASLPIKRSDIISAKYLSIFLFMAITLALYFIISLILGTLRIIEIENSVNLNVLLIYIFQVLFVSSLYFPVNFKFGYSKVRYLNTFLVLIIAFAPQFLEIYPYTKNIVLKITSYSDIMFNLNVNLIFMLLSALLFLISFVISCHIYKDKELN